MNLILVSSIIETLGLGIFLFYLFRGLKQKISALEGTVTIQSKTLEVMEKRIHETEKVGDIYRNLMSDLPQDLDNYKTILSKTKDETILELKNQQEITKKKLEEAQRHIEKSQHSPDTIKQHLKVLKNLLSEPILIETQFPKREYDLAQICQYGDHSVEQCVPVILTTNTLEEFLSRIGFYVVITQDKEIMKSVFGSKSRVTPKGMPLKYATGSHSITGGWHVIANDEFYMNEIRLSELKDEFSSIKTFS